MEVGSLCRLGSIRAGFQVGFSVYFKGSAVTSGALLPAAVNSVSGLRI
jgi:hypothetical protein